MTFRPELIDELLKDYRSPEDLMGEGGIFKQLTASVIVSATYGYLWIVRLSY